MGGGSPRDRVDAARRRWGDEAVVDGCAHLLRLEPDAVPTGFGLDLALVLGGTTDRSWLASGRPPANRYWARVWGGRALLYVWSEVAGPAVVGALADPHWRVREMAAKVVRRQEVGEAADLLVHVAADPVPRVRAAGVLALGVVGEGEHADAVVDATRDVVPEVAIAAERARQAMALRLDRRL